MQLSKKQKYFSQYFAAYLESTSHFELFEKKRPLICFVFPKLETLKDIVVKCLKGPFSDHDSTVNMLKSPKNCTTTL